MGFRQYDMVLPFIKSNNKYTIVYTGLDPNLLKRGVLTPSLS